VPDQTRCYEANLSPGVVDEILQSCKIMFSHEPHSNTSTSGNPLRAGNDSKKRIGRPQRGQASAMFPTADSMNSSHPGVRVATIDRGRNINCNIGFLRQQIDASRRELSLPVSARLPTRRARRFSGLWRANHAGGVTYSCRQLNAELSNSLARLKDADNMRPTFTAFSRRLGSPTTNPAHIGSRSMITGNAVAFVVDNTKKFPTFCSVAFHDDNRAAVSWIDFWAVKPCGNAAADYARGRRYADEAIWHVRTTGQPGFIECVLLFMGMKLRDRDAGELEQGFVDRIVNDFPNALDEVVTRILRRRPVLPN